MNVDTCYLGDVRDGLRAFAAAGIRAQTCVTSPPYWGLRDYGTAEWDGGDAACDHKKPNADTGHIAHTTLGGGLSHNAAQVGGYKQTCGKCGARRIDRQIGLEPTPDEYVATMVDVFRCVRDVLADDGTLWLNLGDSYAGGKTGRDDLREFSHSGGIGNNKRPQDGQKHAGATATQRAVPVGLKPKDLVGIPWLVAFALQADGWYLRSDIIWHKTNPMPESVTDRPTKAHEYLFLLSKQERYLYDAAAIAEPAIGGEELPRRHGNGETVQGAGGGYRVGSVNGTRNKRTVWSITTEPYSEAHFAVMPTALVEPCILAGSRPGDVVLDPFMGSGTVAKVAQSLGRRWIGCELNPDYHAMQKRRAAQTGLALA